MSHSSVEVAAGAVVLAAAGAFLFYAVQVVGNGALGGDSYALTASFRSAEGISEGTDVRLAGVKVGTVTDMVLNPRTFRADTTLSIQGDLALPEDTAVIVASEGCWAAISSSFCPVARPSTWNRDPRSRTRKARSAC